MDRPCRADRLGRAVALLALVVGLLAMHGVAGAHHAAAGTETHGTAHATSAHATSAHATSAHATSGHVAAPTEHGTDHATHGYDGSRVGHALTAAGVLVALPASGFPGCDDDCEPGVATLCVAVLAVTAIAVAAGLAARSRTSTLQASERPRARAPVVLRLPPRLDPVAELCVSRT